MKPFLLLAAALTCGLGIVWLLERWILAREDRQRSPWVLLRRLLEADPSAPPRVIHRVSDGRERLTEWQLRKLRQDAKRKRA